MNVFAVVQGVSCGLFSITSERISFQQVCFFWFRIIPQAVSVRYGLAVGATCAPLVLAMMYIFGLQQSTTKLLFVQKSLTNESI